jgi:hypothetical protein
MTCCDHRYGRPSWSPQVFLRQAQDRLPLRRTVQVRLGPIPRYRGTVARWHAHLCGLATATHEISGLIIQYRLPASAKRHKTPGSCFAPSETQEPCPVMNLNPEIRFILLIFISRRAMSAQALPKKLVYSTWDLRCQLCGWSKR